MEIALSRFWMQMQKKTPNTEINHGMVIAPD
jgi:hypothetical protein